MRSPRLPIDLMPFLAMMNAIAPKAPNGASFIRKPNAANSAAENDSRPAQKGFSAVPARRSPKPVMIEMKSTGRTSPSANGVKKLCGMM